MNNDSAGGFEIRKVSSGEMDAASVLFNQYRIFYGKESDLIGARSYLGQRISNEESEVFVAWKEGGQAVGFMQLYPSFSSVSMQRVWILNDLFVDEAYRGQGVARKLMETAVDLGKRTGAKSLSLCTAVDNRTAQRLYESFGFCKDENFYYYSYTI